MTGGWEFLEHTADIGLAARGRDLSELFANAGVGLFDLIVGLDLVEERVAREVSVEGVDLPDLLVVWLNELLYIFEVEGLVFRRFAIQVDESGPRLRATGYGERLVPARHSVKLGVKAATRHQVEVAKAGTGPDRPWRARVYLDV